MVVKSLTTVLRNNNLAALSHFKYSIDLHLDKAKQDIVIQNDNVNLTGITDISFERRETKYSPLKKTVSLFYKSDKEGIKAYRHAASLLSKKEGVELMFTPHFGQSRITFDFEEFFTTMAEIDSSPILLIPPNATEKDKE